MRNDIELLNNYILLEITVNKYGQPNNNNSKICTKCQHCGIDMEITIFQLKNRLKRINQILCNSCGVKNSWSEEKRVKIKAYWDNPINKEKESQIRKQMWSNPSYQEKHSIGCKQSYKNSDRKLVVSNNTKKLWQNSEFRQNQITKKKELWQDSKYREKQINFRTNEFRQKQSEKQKLICQNPDIKKYRSLIQKQVCNRPGYKLRQSIVQKLVWKRPGYRQKQSQIQKEIWKRPEYRLVVESKFQSIDYRKKLSEIVKNNLNNPETKVKLSLASKKRWEKPEYRQNQIIRLKEKWKNPIYKIQASIRSKNLWKNSDYLEKFGRHRAAQSGRKSSIEIITESILNSLSIQNIPQSPVGPYIFDFLLPQYDVYIECQGEYWHSLPGRDSKDAAKFSYLEKAIPDARVLYLLEHEFMNPNLVSSKINKFCSGSEVNENMIDFDFKNIKLKIVNKDIAKKFLNSFHYAQYGRSAKLSYGIFYENEIIAVCKFSTPIRAEVATSLNFKPNDILELDRFCIHPNFHKKNFASWVLSHCSKLVFSNLKIKCLVAFADMTYNHIGTIYKASNWREIGKVNPDYYYINNEGWILHKKTLYNRAVKMGLKEREYAEKHGYIKSFGKEKTKFILSNKRVGKVNNS